MYSIDLNCDVGEGVADEAAIMPLISSCSIACGGHYGHLKSIKNAVAMALDYGVAIGPHPAYPDPQNFGRKSMDISLEELQIALRKQLDLFWKVSDDVNHIKPHGALYNDLFSDNDKGEALLAVFKEYLPNGKIFCPPNSPWSTLIKKAGFIPVLEGFGDRSYCNDGKLLDRTRAGSVLNDKKKVIDQITQMVRNKSVTTFENQIIPMDVQTICLHGDNPEIIKHLKFIKQQFDLYEIQVKKV